MSEQQPDTASRPSLRLLVECPIEMRHYVIALESDAAALRALLGEMAEVAVAGGDTNFRGTGEEVSYVVMPSIKFVAWLERVRAALKGKG